MRGHLVTSVRSDCTGKTEMIVITLCPWSLDLAPSTPSIKKKQSLIETPFRENALLNGSFLTSLGEKFDAIMTDVKLNSIMVSLIFVDEYICVESV